MVGVGSERVKELQDVFMVWKGHTTWMRES